MRNITTCDIIAIIGVFALTAMVIWGTWQYRNNGKINVPIGGVIVVEYNGHGYLHFASRGLVHNPDCPCKKKGE